MTELKKILRIIYEVNLKEGVSVLKNDIEIVQGIINKSPEALDLLMIHYKKLIYFIANTILITEEEKSYIDECYSEVMTTLWFNMDCFDQSFGNLKGWIISITKYKALDIKRKLNKNNNDLEFLSEVIKDKKDDFKKLELEEILNNILKTLSEKDQMIFIKRYLEGYSIKEIADMLGSSENYIHTRISRGRKKLEIFKEEVEL